MTHAQEHRFYKVCSHKKYIPADLPPFDKQIAQHLIDNDWLFVGRREDVSTPYKLNKWSGNIYGWEILTVETDNYNELELYVRIDGFYYTKLLFCNTNEKSTRKAVQLIGAYIREYGNDLLKPGLLRCHGQVIKLQGKGKSKRNVKSKVK